MSGKPKLDVIKAEDLKNFYYAFWVTAGYLPTEAKIAEAFNCNPVAIRNWLDDEDFIRDLVKRGVPLTLPKVLTPDQIRALAILTDPTLKGGLQGRLRVANLPHATYRAWMRQPHFKANMTALAETIFEENLAGVNMGLVNAAERGDVSAVKFFYEVTNRYRPSEGKAMDVMALLAGVVEILSVEVKDPATLEAIAGKLQTLAINAGVTGLGGAAQQAPVAINVPLGRLE